MYAHFDRAGEVHDALVRGRLDRARPGAEWLATHQEPRMLPEGSDQIGALMKMYAQNVREAEDLQEAAHATAQMGRTCGDCHRQYGVSPRFLVGTAPPSGSGARAEMSRHVWAAERMWEGLVGPEDYAWTSGAAALKEGWLNPRDVVSDAGDRERVRDLVRQVYTLGVQADRATTPEDRARIYGEFLTTCIDCHVLTEAIIR
jgi:mono/diheme cytochrome c family protein